jgi:hypothetical protein
MGILNCYIASFVELVTIKEHKIVVNGCQQRFGFRCPTWFDLFSTVKSNVFNQRKAEFNAKPTKLSGLTSKSPTSTTSKKTKN